MGAKRQNIITKLYKSRLETLSTLKTEFVILTVRPFKKTSLPRWNWSIRMIDAPWKEKMINYQMLHPLQNGGLVVWWFHTHWKRYVSLYLDRRGNPHHLNFKKAHFLPKLCAWHSVLPGSVQGNEVGVIVKKSKGISLDSVRAKMTSKPKNIPYYMIWSQISHWFHPDDSPEL